MTSDFSHTKVTIDLPPSSSGLLVDSRGRGSNETPYDFIVNFSSAIRGSQITYSKFHWSQPLYAHTGVSCAFMFDLFKPDDITDPTVGKWYPGFVNNEDYLNEHFVIYHKPYCSYTTFDGNEEDGIPFQTPKAGSYASDVETALNTDVRVTSNNLIPYSLDNIFPDIQFRFRYSSSQGFRLSATYTDETTDTTVPLGIRIWDCNSIQIAHRVHGFGVECLWNPLDVNRGLISSQADFIQKTGSLSGQKCWLPSWLAAFANNIRCNNPPTIDLSSSNVGLSYVYYSDSNPTLIPIEYVQIYSPELTFQRKLPSFRNIGAQSTSGNDEIGTFATTIENIGRFQTLGGEEDANVWSLRSDYCPQTARFIVTDEDGKTLTCSAIMTTFFGTLNGNVNANTYQLPFTDESQKFRSAGAMNYLIFGINSITEEGIFLSPTEQWGSPSAVSLECEVAHHLEVINA